VPDDVKNMRHQVLRHRIGLNYAAVVDNISAEEIIDMLVNAVPTP
jgi:MoxR-like ATPase